MTNKINERGITLVALVITIIVLIILSTVTISTLMGDNGLISQAKKTKNDVSGTISDAGDETNKLLDEYANMMKTNSEVTPPTVPQPIEDVLKEGDYVNYKDSKGKIRKCVVLYGPENTNYSSCGIQIIAMESVEEVTLGSSDFNTSMASYNDAISTLNKKAREYNNYTYSADARCVGSAPGNPDYDGPGMCNNQDPWFLNYNGQIKDEDKSYSTDYSKMENIHGGILNIGTTYWLASRKLFSDPSYRTGYLYVYSIDSTGTLISSRLCFLYLDTSNNTGYSKTNGFRPIFILKSGIKVISGDGSKDSPYELGE